MKKAVYVIFCVISISAFAYKSAPLWPIPSHIPQPEKKLTALRPEEIELGRVLFYDAQFSADGLVSCASCHNPYNAFAHTDHPTSHGVFDSVGRRNAPALFNLAWHKKFMHDGAAHSLDAQALAPLTSSKEIGSTLQAVQTKMVASAMYQDLFEKAGYSEPTITGALKALEAFQLSLISLNSKYDRVQEGRDSFNKQESQGFEVFTIHCSKCHVPPMFNSHDFELNGLPIDSNLLDLGRFEQTGKKDDLMRFKVPSLRNISYTYPYMHDGRFQTLREVLDHYSPSTGTLGQSPLSTILTAREKTDLIAFLKTLNDSEFVFNPSHQFPRWILP